MTAKWMNLKDATTHTNLSRKTLERAIEDGRLKFGGTLGRTGRLIRRFSAEQLDAFMASTGRKGARKTA